MSVATVTAAWMLTEVFWLLWFGLVLKQTGITKTQEKNLWNTLIKITQVGGNIVTSFYLIKQCSNCGSQYDNREVDEQEALDREYDAVSVSYDHNSDIKEIMVIGCCPYCDEEEM